MTRRPLNVCMACRSQWYPRGSDVAARCPRCGSEDVQPVFEQQQEDRQPSPRPATGGGCSCGGLIGATIVICFGLVLVVAAITALGTNPGGKPGVMPTMPTKKTPPTPTRR